MTAYSIWPYFAAMAVLLLLVATPLFRAADALPNPDRPRISTLDGLRGFSALGVFFHHSAFYHDYLSNGLWRPPPSRFYMLLGESGVAMFFMITGFLFWSRIIREKNDAKWISLYVGRLFRIAPLYLFAVGSGLIIVFAKKGFALHVPPVAFAKELVCWLSLGFLNLTGINGYSDAPLVLAGVTWTLQYEWFFYLSLPILAFVASRRSCIYHSPP